ncbi:MAG: DUF4175 family protein, partial [Rhabdaerophilum sp.]
MTQTDRNRPMMSPVQPDDAARPDLGWRYAQSYLALLSEKLWPVLLLPLCLSALFIAAAWAGLPVLVPPMGRLAVAIAGGLAIALSLLPLRHFRLPTRGEIEKRLDRSRPDAHRPLATLADSPAASSDPISQALWEAHRARAREKLDALEAKAGDARLRWRDGFALRL